LSTKAVIYFYSAQLSAVQRRDCFHEMHCNGFALTGEIENVTVA